MCVCVAGLRSAVLAAGRQRHRWDSQAGADRGRQGEEGEEKEPGREERIVVVVRKTHCGGVVVVRRDVVRCGGAVGPLPHAQGVLRARCRPCGVPEALPGGGEGCEDDQLPDAAPLRVLLPPGTAGRGGGLHWGLGRAWGERRQVVLPMGPAGAHGESERPPGCSGDVSTGVKWWCGGVRVFSVGGEGGGSVVGVCVGCVNGGDWTTPGCLQGGRGVWGSRGQGRDLW
ncbi:hypothetical protein E2C01_067315 [Portunus trituberculatus]|uniref:Uncharacterized protein n=1 Tax=Portunus trituberculatus TaxID=210409 RepID=A0A5B7HTA1_PORTR|nr:hypothetical protein [Portunus trituberculatus]